MIRSSISVATTLALILGTPALASAKITGPASHHAQASSQTTPTPDTETEQAPDTKEQDTSRPGGAGIMGQGMMGQMMQQGMDPEMMGRGIMDRGIMGPNMLRVMFILMDADGNESLSLEEVQAAHKRIYAVIDVDKNGGVTFEELQAFMRGAGKPMPMRGSMPMHDGSRGR